MTKRKNIKIIINSSLPGILPDQAAAPTPMVRRRAAGKRAAFCTTKRRASFTVEAALILPLFLLGVLALFNTFEVFRLYLKESVELKEKAERTAMYAYGTGEEQNWEGTFADGYVTLTKIISYKVKYFPVPLPALRIPCHARVHTWTGYDGEKEPSQGKGDTEMVFVSEYQSVYHTNASCTYLELHVYKRKLEEAKREKNAGGARYQPCERCIGDGGSSSVVYLSEYGRAYHNSLACSGLKRSVRLIRKSDAGGLPCCSRCAAGRAENE